MSVLPALVQEYTAGLPHLVSRTSIAKTSLKRTKANLPALTIDRNPISKLINSGMAGSAWPASNATEQPINDGARACARNS